MRYSLHRYVSTMPPTGACPASSNSHFLFFLCRLERRGGTYIRGKIATAVVVSVENSFKETTRGIVGASLGRTHSYGRTLGSPRGGCSVSSGISTDSRPPSYNINKAQEVSSCRGANRTLRNSSNATRHQRIRTLPNA